MTSETDRSLRSGLRKVSYRYELLNRFDRPIGGAGVISAEIRHNEFAAVKRAASFVFPEKLVKEVNFLSERIRPWFVLHLPDGGLMEWPLGIFLLESPSFEISGTSKALRVTGYDKTLIPEQYVPESSVFFAKGTPYTAALEQIINMAGIVDVRIARDGTEIPVDIEFPIGTKGSDIAASLLRGINYTPLSADEMGTIVTGPYIPPLKRDVTKHYGSAADSVITPGITQVTDIATRPNVFIRLAENIDMERALISVAENNDVNHPLSTWQRGRRIVDFAKVREPMTQAALDAYVHRKAVLSVSAYRYIDFKTLNMPTHGNAEIIHLDLPEVSSTPMKVHEVSWSMDLRPGGSMSHRARMAVDI